MFLFVQSFLFAQYFVFIFQPKKQYWLYFAPQQLNFTTPLPFSPFSRSSSSIRQSISARALNFRQKCAPAILCDVFRLRFWLLLEFTGFLMNRILESETRLEIFYGAQKTTIAFLVTEYSEDVHVSIFICPCKKRKYYSFSKS